MSLLNYFIKRLFQMVFILFGVLILTFFLSRMMPGSPFLPGAGEKVDYAFSQAEAARIGLDKPLIEQFFIYLRNILTGDWGRTYKIQQGTQVWDLIIQKMSVTFELGIASTFLASVIGIKVGVFSAVNRNSPKDTIVRFIALFGVAVPVFWLGMLLQYYVGTQLGLFPAVDYYSSYMDDPLPITHLRTLDSLLTGRFDLFVDTIHHMFLPTTALTFITLAGITRQSRSSMLEVLELDYIRSARAKGCKERDVINKHALRNALIPTVTIIGMNFGGILGGAVMTETTFDLNGFGMLIVDAINQKDYNLINALVFLTSFIFIFMNLVTDLLYAILDPRIRY